VLWIRIDELRVQGMKRSSAIFWVATDGVVWVSNRFFGANLFSGRGIAVALLFPMVIFLALIEYAVVALAWKLAVVVIAYACVLIGPGCLLFFGARGRVGFAAIVVLLSAEAFTFALFWKFISVEEPGSLPGLLIGAVTAVAVIAANRAILRWCAATGSVRRALIASIVNGTIILAVTIAPWWYSRSFKSAIDSLQRIEDEYLALKTPDISEIITPPVNDPEATIRARRDREAKLSLFAPKAHAAERQLHHYHTVSNFFYGVAFADASAALIALSPLLMFGVLAAHRMIWSVAGKIIYPLSQYGVLESRRALMTIGLSLLILAAGPGIAGTILKALK